MFSGVAKVQAQNETVYFLVGRMLGCMDGYVLPLTRPADIEHARELVEHGPKAGQPIVVARISRDVQGININRNYCVSPAPSWSWYVTEFLCFGGVTAEILDGTPTMVENGSFAGGGVIGFWCYTVKKELGTDLNPWCEVLKPDCAVDSYDLALLAEHWLEIGCKYPEWCGDADLNVSGKVDFFDFALLAKRWLSNN